MIVRRNGSVQVILLLPSCLHWVREFLVDDGWGDYITCAIQIPHLSLEGVCAGCWVVLARSNTFFSRISLLGIGALMTLAALAHVCDSDVHAYCNMAAGSLRSNCFVLFSSNAFLLIFLCLHLFHVVLLFFSPALFFIFYIFPYNFCFPIHY